MKYLALLLLALAGCNSADADELLWGSPVGSGVVSIPFDSSQAAGCMSWDGTNIDTHPANPDCDGGSGSSTFSCPTPGYALVGVTGGSPTCVPLSTPIATTTYQPTRTPDATRTPYPTETPWACGAGAVAIGQGASAPTCAILPTPDGAGGGSPVAGNYIDVTGSTIDFDPTEIGSVGSAVTWGSPADAPVTWTFDTAGGDPAMTYSNGGLTFANTPDANDLVLGVHGGVTANTVTTPQLNATTQAYLDSGATIQFEGATPDGFETTVTVTDPTADRTLTLPNETGTFCTTGSVCSSYQAGPLSGDVVTSGAAATIQANSVALGTDTTNDYVATVSGSSGVSCTGTGETAAVACTATLGTTIAPTEMASSDFGSFTCNGTTCSLDGNTVTNAEVTDASLVYADINNTSTLAGNPTNGASSAWTATTGFIFEGATSDTIEGLLTAADPTSTDKTWTLPDVTGTIITTGDTGTVTSTMIANGAIAFADLAFATPTPFPTFGTTATPVPSMTPVPTVTPPWDISSQTNLTASGGVTLTGDNLTADLGTSVDISAETNLAVTSPIVLTGDTVSIANADDDGTTKGAVTFSNTNFDCTTGVCDLSSNVITSGSTIQPSQLEYLAGDDSPRKWGADADVTEEWKNSLGQFRVTVKATPVTAATPAVRWEFPTGTGATTKTRAVTVAGSEVFVEYGDGSVGSAGSWVGSLNAGSAALKIPTGTASVLTTAGLVSYDTDSVPPNIAVGTGSQALPIRSCPRQIIQTSTNTSGTTYCLPGLACNSTSAAIMVAADLNLTFARLRVSLWEDQPAGGTATVAVTLQTAAASSCAASVDGNPNQCSFSDTALTCTITGGAGVSDLTCTDLTHSVQLTAGDFYRFKLVNGAGVSSPFPTISYQQCDDSSW